MKKTQDALKAFELTEYGTRSFKFGDNMEYELAFEPLLFEKQMYVALYKNEDLLVEKVVVKPGFI